MKILIIGLGSIGKRHLACLREYDDIEIWSLRRSESKEDAADFSDRTFYNDEVIAKIHEVSGIIISNPTAFHIPTALFHAKFKIPLFIEKPLGHTMDGVSELSHLCKSNHVPVLMGNNLMYHPGILKIENLLSESAIGEVINVRAQFGTYMPEWHPNEDFTKSYASLTKLGGGVTLTSIHEINYVTHLFGEIDMVLALEIKKNILGIDAEEGVEILLRHKNGIVSSINLNYYQVPRRRFCEIVGTEGTLYWDFWEPYVQVRYRTEKRTINLGSDALSLLKESYDAQMSHFIEICNQRVNPKVPLSKGRYDLKIALEILKQIGRR